MAPYTNHIKNGLLTNIELFFITKKYKDGYFHLGHLERKLLNPKLKITLRAKCISLQTAQRFRHLPCFAMQ